LRTAPHAGRDAPVDTSMSHASLFETVLSLSPAACVRIAVYIV
jgi:hypothetical protein